MTAPALSVEDIMVALQRGALLVRRGLAEGAYDHTVTGPTWARRVADEMDGLVVRLRHGPLPSAIETARIEAEKDREAGRRAQQRVNEKLSALAAAAPAQEGR